MRDGSDDSRKIVLHCDIGYARCQIVTSVRPARKSFEEKMFDAISSV